MILGRSQTGVLKALAEHGYWHSMCGWRWDTESDTLRVLESLVRRGEVVKTPERMRWNSSYVTRDVYRVRTRG